MQNDSSLKSLSMKIQLKHKWQFPRFTLLGLAISVTPLVTTQSAIAQSTGQSTWDLRGRWVLEVGWFQWDLSNPLGTCRVDPRRGVLQIPISFVQNGDQLTANATVAGDSNGTVIGNGTISGNRFESSESDGLIWVGTISEDVDENGGAVTKITGTEYCGEATLPFTITRLDPTPYPQENLGSLDYYRFRFDDFVRRNPESQPPDYYLNFGERYLRRFRLEARPNLTEQGQAFVDRVGVALQRRMEAELQSNPLQFAELEQNSAEFRRFAYETHIATYCESGWGDLPLADNRTIASYVDELDLFRGVGTSISISSECGWIGDIEEFFQGLPFPW